MATADPLGPVVRDTVPEEANRSPGETHNARRWSQLIHRLRPHRWLMEAASKRQSQSLSTISESPPRSANPKRTIPAVRHLQRVAEWVVERSSQLGRSPPPRSSPPSPQMQPRAHIRPRPLTQAITRSQTQTDTRARSLAQCSCHGDRTAFGAATADAAYSCYPYDEFVGDSPVLAHHPHHSCQGVYQSMAPAYPPSSYDTYSGDQRVLGRYGHYR